MLIDQFSTNCNAVTYEQFTYKPDKFTKLLIRTYGRQRAFYLVNLIYNKQIKLKDRASKTNISRHSLRRVFKKFNFDNSLKKGYMLCIM